MASKIKKGIISYLSNIRTKIYPYNAISEAQIVNRLQNLSKAKKYETKVRGFNRTLNELYEYDILEKWYYDEDKKSLIKYDENNPNRKPRFYRIVDEKKPPPDETYRRYIIKSKIYCNNIAEDIQAHTFTPIETEYTEEEIKDALLEAALYQLKTKENSCGGGAMVGLLQDGELTIENIKNHFGFNSTDETDSYDVLFPEIDVS